MDKVAKPGKLPRPAKSTKKIVAKVKRASDGQGAGGSSAGSGTGQPSCDTSVGVLVDTGSDQQNICMYTGSGGLLPLQLNAYATLGLVPLQTNGLAVIQTNLVPHDLLNIGSNGQVSVLSGATAVHDGSNGHANGVTNGQILGLGNMSTFVNGQIIGLGNILCGGQVDLVSNGQSSGHSNVAALTNQVNGQSDAGSHNNGINGRLDGQLGIYSNGKLIAQGSIPSDQANGCLEATAAGQIIGVSSGAPGSLIDAQSSTYAVSGQLLVSSRGYDARSGAVNADGGAFTSGNGISSGRNGQSDAGISNGNGSLISLGHDGVSRGNTATLWNSHVNGNGSVVANEDAAAHGNGSVDDAHATDFSNANGSGATFPLSGTVPVRLDCAGSGAATAPLAVPLDDSVDLGSATASPNGRLGDT